MPDRSRLYFHFWQSRGAITFNIQFPSEGIAKTNQNNTSCMLIMRLDAADLTLMAESSHLHCTRSTICCTKTYWCIVSLHNYNHSLPWQIVFRVSSKKYHHSPMCREQRGHLCQVQISHLQTQVWEWFWVRMKMEWVEELLLQKEREESSAHSKIGLLQQASGTGYSKGYISSRSTCVEGIKLNWDWEKAPAWRRGYWRNKSGESQYICNWHGPSIYSQE